MVFIELFFAIVAFAFAYGFLMVAITSVGRNKWFFLLWSLTAAVVVGLLGFHMLLSVFKISDRAALLITGAVAIIIAIALVYIAYISVKQNAKMITVDFILVAILTAMIGIGVMMPDSDNSTTASSEHNIVGQKLSNAYAKNHDDMYYTDKDDSNIRYFVNDDNKITAVKYVFGANHYPFSSVESELSNAILHDDHLKYTTDKDSRDDFDPDGNSFNVYSPDREKWYHVKMQRDDDGKISSFVVWPGQSDDADDY